VLAGTKFCQPIGGSSYTLIYSARTDLDADIPADIPGNAIRELADLLVKEARRAEEARLRLKLSERARSTLEAELADERRRREETERERDELRQELEGLKLEVLRESREEAPESPKSPSPRFADWLFWLATLLRLGQLVPDIVLDTPGARLHHFLGDGLLAGGPPAPALPSSLA
jgi:hypothetical protein